MEEPTYIIEIKGKTTKLRVKKLAMRDKNGKNYKMKGEDPVPIDNFTSENLVEVKGSLLGVSQNVQRSSMPLNFKQGIEKGKEILKSKITETQQQPAPVNKTGIFGNNNSVLGQVLGQGLAERRKVIDGNEEYSNEEDSNEESDFGGMRKKYRPSVFDNKRRTRGKQSAHKCDIIHKNSCKSKGVKKSQKNIKQNIKKRRQIYTRRNKK